MSKVTIHNGPYSTIPSNATPGLQFLKDFFPALDTLDPGRHPIAPFLPPDASIIVGNQAASPANLFIPLLEVRSKHIARFQHDLEVAWDIEHPNVTGDVGTHSQRTVMFEATSVTVFRNDPDQFEVKVKEFNIIELVPSSVEQERRGLLAREIRTYSDTRPVQDRAARLHLQSTFAESRAQY